MHDGKCGSKEMRGRTEADAVEPLAFAEDAVELPHLPKRSLRPAMFGDDRLNLRPESFDPFRMPREVVQDVRDTLREVRG